MNRLILDTRELNAGAAGAVEGYGWLTATPDATGDEIPPSAFAKAAAPLPMLLYHNLADPVGVWDEIKVDGKGLRVKGRLLIDGVARAREAYELVKERAITALSIGFQMGRFTAKSGGGRVIHSLNLREISLVTVGAHPGARISSVKQADRLLEALNRASAALRAN